MKLVVLDSYTAVSTDLSLDCFKPYCDEMAVYERTPPEEVAARIGDAEAVLINKTVITRRIFELCPRLQYIGLFATGYNVVDIEAAKDHGVVVSNAPAYSTNAVAQLTFAMILHFYSLVSSHDARVHTGEWTNCRDFCFYDPRIRELAGKTIGLIGFGNIAKKVAQLAQAFDMPVLVWSRTQYPEYENQMLRFVPFETLLQNSDIVSLHCPLFPSTYHLIDRSAVAQMKAGALLVNTARGAVLDEQAVADALNSGHLSGAGIDVAEKEPIPGDSPLLSAKNCVITPHIAWACRESRERLIETVLDNFQSFLAGKPKNNVAK